jgi:hypothetical protein
MRHLTSAVPRRQLALVDALSSYLADSMSPTAVHLVSLRLRGAGEACPSPRSNRTSRVPPRY